MSDQNQKTDSLPGSVPTEATGAKVKRLVRGAWLSAIALLILAKGFEANDLNDTLWSDPMELWIAAGVAVLLIERASDVLGGKS